MAAITIEPQKGPQTQFLSSSADIVIYGGQAGGGKTYALLMEGARHYRVPGFSCVIFRRTYPEITNPGGLLDTSFEIYPYLNGELKENSWKFISYNTTVKFSHLQHEKDRLAWQGAQIPLIEFDELQSFSESQFFFFLSRNRSTCGVRPYIRATCNPDSDSWLAVFLDWWIDQNTGYPIEERSGKVRYFVRPNEDIVWASSREELLDQYPEVEPKSVTFIKAELEDNVKLLEKDPAYKSNLFALPLVERERLARGNWKITHAKGYVFKKEWFFGKIVASFPMGCKKIRTWDFAATEKKIIRGKSNDPDYTATCLAAYHDGKFYIQLKRAQYAPALAEKWFFDLAQREPDVPVIWEQEPGSASIRLGYNLRMRLSEMGRSGIPIAPSGDKVVRASAWSAQAEAGNVYIVEGEMNTDDILAEFYNFPSKDWNDDMIDAVSIAWNNRDRRGVIKVEQI